MALSHETKDLLGRWLNTAEDIGKVLSGDNSVSWKDARASFGQNVEKMFPVPEDVTASMVDLGGVPTLLLEPEDIADDRALFYIHGGGYVHGALGSHKGLAGKYAKRMKARVYMPDYRQAPESQFPVPIEDTYQAYKALLEKVGDHRKIAISGDSAGGGMLITIMRWARNEGISLPVGAVAISPWADLTHSGSSPKTRNGLDPLCGMEFLEQLARTFLGDSLATDPDASPVFADVKGLPPVLIQMGENEVMLSGGIKLAERLAEQRVRTTLEVWPDMFHVWHHLAGQLKEADEALDNAVDFLNREYNRAIGK